MKSNYLAGFAIIALMLLPTIGSVGAAPTTVVANALNLVSQGTSGGVGHQCYSSGYYYLFYQDLTGNLAWVSSQTGAIWSAPTAITSGVSVLSYALSCDSLGHIYLTWDINDKVGFSFQDGSTSAGLIIWNASASLSCTHGGGNCQVESIYAFDLSHVWIAVFSSTGRAVQYNEVWGCQTSPCTSTINWADSSDALGNGCYGGGCQVVGGSTNQRVAFVTTATTGSTFYYTVDGGATWLLGANALLPYDLLHGQCVGVGDSIYCGVQNTFDVGNHAYDHIYLLAYTIGASTLTQSVIDTLPPNAYLGDTTWVGLATDGTNAVVVYSLLDTCHNAAICSGWQYQTTTSLSSSSTWTAPQTLVTGEGNETDFAMTPTLQSNLAGVAWLGIGDRPTTMIRWESVDPTGARGAVTLPPPPPLCRAGRPPCG